MRVPARSEAPTQSSTVTAPHTGDCVPAVSAPAGVPVNECGVDTPEVDRGVGAGFDGGTWLEGQGDAVGMMVVESRPSPPGGLRPALTATPGRVSTVSGDLPVPMLGVRGSAWRHGSRIARRRSRLATCQNAGARDRQQHGDEYEHARRAGGAGDCSGGSRNHHLSHPVGAQSHA